MPVPAADLSRFPPLSLLPQAALEPLAQQADTRSFAAGATILDFADTSRDVYCIVEGAVRVVVRTRLGHEVILKDLGPGELFGEMAAIEDAPRTASVAALQKTRAYVLPPQAFLDAVLGHPPLALKMLQTLSERLRDRDERTLELVALPVRLRLIAELLRMARNRVGGAHRSISPPPPQHELASRIGTRREVVSREMTQLAREGLIEIDRRAIRLLQPDKLVHSVQAGFNGTDVG